MDITNALTSLTEALKKRERELDEREKELNEKMERVDGDIRQIYGTTSPSDVLHLNIGGQRIDVLRRTICSIDGSMLASKFSGRWDDSLEKDENGHYFLDHDFEDFKMMIDFLRGKAIETPNYPVVAPQGTRNFFRLLEYYGMTDGVYPVHMDPLYVTDESNDSFEILKKLQTLHIHAKEWCTFQLVRQGHTRKIESFEVRLGKVHRFQIGFVDKSDPFVYSQSIGVGDIPNTYSLDTVRSCILKEGTKTDVEGVEVKEGSIIKVELCGKWYVDGTLVASDDKIKFNIPAISIKGEATVIHVAYGN